MPNNPPPWSIGHGGDVRLGRTGHGGFYVSGNLKKGRGGKDHYTKIKLASRYIDLLDIHPKGYIQ
jgi:hypothetical protein